MGQHEKYGGIAAGILCAAAGVWIGMRAEEVLIPALLPLVLAAAAARLVSPSADAVSRAFRVNRKTGGAVWASLLCGLAVWLAGLLGGRLAAEMTELLSLLPHWIAAAARKAGEIAEELRARLPVDLPVSMFSGDAGPASDTGSQQGSESGLLASLLIRAATALAEKAGEFFGKTVQGFPGSVLSLAVGAVAFVWLTADPGGAWDSLTGLPFFGENGRRRAEEFRERIARAEGALGRYLRAYLTLTGVTFAELLAGFLILKVENAPAAALLVACVDILPVLGCGTVLAPWAAVCFFGGNGGRGVGLLVLLAAVWATRQFLEPRLVGRAAGIHPFLALCTTYLGLRIFGAAGLLAVLILVCLSAEKETETKPSFT
jgi:predicted PurR-regulated permease PerM